MVIKKTKKILPLVNSWGGSFYMRQPTIFKYQWRFNQECKLWPFKIEQKNLIPYTDTEERSIWNDNWTDIDGNPVGHDPKENDRVLINLTKREDKPAETMKTKIFTICGGKINQNGICEKCYQVSQTTSNVCSRKAEYVEPAPTEGETSRLIQVALDRLKLADEALMKIHPDWSDREDLRMILNLMSTAYNSISQLSRRTEGETQEELWSQLEEMILKGDSVSKILSAFTLIKKP